MIQFPNSGTSSQAPFLPDSIPDFPTLDRQYQVSAEKHPNFYRFSTDFNSWVNYSKGLEVRNVELVGRVNHLNSLNADLERKLSSSKMWYRFFVFLLLCRTVMDLVSYSFLHH